MTLLYTPTAALVQLALDAASLRHLALANNIANAGNPGYARQDVDFDAQLGQARAALSAGGRVDWSDISGVRPRVVTGAANGTTSAIGMLDMEMTRIAQNTLHYQTLLRAASRYGTIMTMAIDEGRR